MERAKAAVSEFVGRHGHHDTTVDERQRPAVKHEEIQPIRHEEVQTAIKREVDQDHYHTTIQPIKDREVLPEKHSHQMAGVQTKEFEHAKPQDIKARLDAEAAQFRDTSTTHSTKTTQAVAPTVEAEIIHHHVHETVQPVIEKEIIAPSVVHTTIPVHERHHAAPEYHGASVLPPKTMSDFKAAAQDLTSGTGVINQDQYEGCPRPYNPEMQLGRTEADADPHLGLRADGTSHGTHTAGPHGTDTANKLDPRVDSDRSSSHHAGAGGLGLGHSSPTGHSHDTSGHKKPSLLDKLNPRKDADGDGKPGFMK